MADTSIGISNDNKKILLMMKIDRNFLTMNDLISSLIKEEIKPISQENDKNQEEKCK